MERFLIALHPEHVQGVNGKDLFLYGSILMLPEENKVESDFHIKDWA